MKRGQKLKRSGNGPQPAGKLELLVAEWPLMTDAERALISLKLAYWLGEVRPPIYDEVVIKPLIIGDEP